MKQKIRPKLPRLLKEIFMFTLYFLVLFLIGCKNPNKGYPAGMKEFVANSDIIFNGHVSVVGSALAFTDNADSSIVVTVDSLLAAPADIALQPGDQLTLLTKNINAYKAGDSRTFYARINAIGENISATETGSTELSKTADNHIIRQNIRNAKMQLFADQLNERIAKADLVVSGKVMHITSLPKQEEIDSEHNPEWLVIEIEVSDKIKGNADKTIRILYPGSNDVAYRNYPKLDSGTEWFYILNRSEIKAVPFQINSHESIVSAVRYKEIKNLLKK